MAKENPPTTSSEEKRLKKEKKEKKRSETDGVHKSSSSSKKDKSERKKDKKDKKSKSEPELPDATAAADAAATAAEDSQMTTQLLNSLEKEKPGSVAVKENGDVEVKVKNVDKPLLVGALVPFANPLADEKVGKKVLKGVKK
ncbi:MAG: hypothetical protein Q9225_008043, partial [Loekoesia sp. 1 TL-2023]